jgi:branched-chain amino acid transport system substrate-binding protein
MACERLQVTREAAFARAANERVAKEEETFMGSDIRRRLGFAAAVAIVVAACSSSGATQAPATAAPATAAPATAAPATAAAASTAPAASGAATCTTQPAATTINVGISGPFTGPNALTGTEMKNASSMAFDAINWQIGPYKINPVYIDDQSDPAKGAAAYEQAAVGQKIIAGILGWHSSVAVAQMEVTAKYKIPHFFAMGATGVVNQKFNSDKAKYGYWTTKGWPDPAKLTIGYVQAIEDAIAAGSYKPAEKKVAIYGEDTDWGRSFGKGLKDQLTAKGWSVVSEDYFPTTQTDFSAIVSRYQSDNVPLIAGTTTIPASIASFLKAIDDSGLKSLVVADGLGWIGDWYKLSGSASDYVVDQIPQFASDAAKKFATDYEAKYGSKPSPSAAGLSYDFSNFFIKVANQALKDSCEITSESLYKVAQEQLWTGKLAYTDGIIMSNYDFASDSIPDPVVGKGHYIFPALQYMKGVGNVVWPADVATGTLQQKP